MTTPARPFVSRISKFRSSTGFTLIELMIVVAIIAIIISLALPVYSSYAIRAKVGEALSLAASAKTAVSATCVEEPTITGLTNTSAGYSHTPTKWIESIEVSADCSAPLITVTTRDTGAPGDPRILLTGNFASGRIDWLCSSPLDNRYLPKECRST